MWCHLENDGNGRWRGQGIAVEKDRSRVWMANADFLGLFVIYRTLVGAS